LIAKPALESSSKKSKEEQEVANLPDDVSKNSK
jgi:DNA replication protein DnaC